AEQVQIDGVLPVFDGRFGDRLTGPAADVVDHDVDRAPLLERPLDDSLDARVRRHVRLDRERFAARLPDLLGDLLESIRPAGADDDATALGGKTECGRAADPA